MTGKPIICISCTLVLLAVLCSGCFFESEVCGEVHNNLQSLNLNRVMNVQLGYISMFTVKNIVRFFDDTDEAMEYLDEISKVKVGIYEVESGADPISKKSLDKIEKALTKKGWDLFVRVREHDEFVLIFYKEKSQNIDSLAAIVLDHDELVVAEIKGDLNKIMNKALQDKNINLDFAV